MCHVNIITIVLHDSILFWYVCWRWCYDFGQRPNKLLNLNLNLSTRPPKVRLSSHKFYVERGRWKNVHFLERKCRLCEVVEDEYHCLIECPLYENVRNYCLPAEHVLLNKPSMHEFVKFLKSEEPDDYMNAGLLCMLVMREYQKYVWSWCVLWCVSGRGVIACVQLLCIEYKICVQMFVLDFGEKPNKDIWTWTQLV